MPTTNDTSIKIDVYLWATSARTAIGLLHLPRNQAARYSTVVAALAAKGRGDDGFPGETLYSITVKEISA